MSIHMNIYAFVNETVHAGGLKQMYNHSRWHYSFSWLWFKRPVGADILHKAIRKGSAFDDALLLFRVSWPDIKDGQDELL